jgi:hypothetical protein
MVECFLDGPLPKLCPVIPISNQDGRQAKNRKKGGMKFKKNLLSETTEKKRRFLWEFPIRFQVKLSSAVAAILVGCLKCQTYFWKGTTQGSFQQNLVEIGSVVSEEKIFSKYFIPPFFYF